MGTKTSKGTPSSQKVDVDKLPVFDTTIIIDKNNTNAFIQLNQLLLFPHGWDGLKIWEAGIALSRFIYKNPGSFKEKRVLDLGTGVGISGLAALLFGEASLVHFTDYRPEIIKNAQRNLERNLPLLEGKGTVKPVCNAFILDWTNPGDFQQEYDVLIGSDLVYWGAPIEDLVSLVQKALKKDSGVFYLLIPSDRMATKSFVDSMARKGFSNEVIELRDDFFYESPLEDEEEGFRVYLGMKKLKFFVHVFRKAKEIKQKE